MRRLLTSGIFIGFCFLTVVILAQVPQLLNYQGRLNDAAGIPITTATTLRFSLYQGGDATTAGSGTLVYEEDASVTPDDNGVFNHLIGSGTVIYGTMDSTVFQTTSPVYLEIAIDPAGANETLLPRKQIVTVGYSFKSELADDADTVDGQDASAFSPVVHNHDPDYVNEGQADSVDSAMIVDGTIVDADIASGANIAGSKIDPTGLDADLLDGKDSLDFVHTTGDTMTGTLSVTTTGAAFALYGVEQSTSGATMGIFGGSDSSSGYGVYGDALYTGVYGCANSSSGINYGVRGQSNSPSGYGIYGRNPAGGYAGYFEGNAHVTGNLTVDGTVIHDHDASDIVSGKLDNARLNMGSGNGIDADMVDGQHASDFATAGHNHDARYFTQSVSDSRFVNASGDDSITGGLHVITDSWAFAFMGENLITDAIAVEGVYGRCDSPLGRAIKGWATATSGINYGVYGQSSSSNGYAVAGWASANSGTNYGVSGVSSSSDGYGIYGANAGGGYAGYFEGNAHVIGDFTVGGTKTCVQPIDNGKKVLLYAMESPEIWFEDFGTAQLVNGEAVVAIENVFAQTANIEMGYLIFLTPIGECQGLYISRKDKDSFEVRELGSGTSNITFDYRIVAKRRGYEEVRFEEFTEPEQPPAEPNLPIEKK